MTIELYKYCVIPSN